jgi:hypothetical protein
MIKNKVFSDAEIVDILSRIENSNSASKSIAFPLFLREYLLRENESYLYDIWLRYCEVCIFKQYHSITYATAYRYLRQVLQNGLIEKTRKEDPQPTSGNLRPSRKRQYYELNRALVDDPKWKSITYQVSG